MAGSRAFPRADSIVPRLAASILASCLLAHPLMLAAQDRSAPQRLEDLIPDSAIDAPDEWATEGAPAGEAPVDDLVEPEAPFDAIEVPSVEPIEPTEEAALEEQASDPFAGVIDLPLRRVPELDTVRIDRGLELAFPVELDAFPERDAFVARYRLLREAERIGNGEDNVALRAARIRADRDLLERQLRVYGYYDARVSRSLDERDEAAEAEGRTPAVRFAVQPGERYRFGVIELGQLGAAPDASDLRATFAIETGDPLLADRIVERRNALATALGESGYPFARLEPPELLIDHKRSEGDLSMPVTPGGKYAFGEVTSSLPDFLSGKHLSRIARFEPGDVYQQSLEEDLRRAILATGLVSSVTIAPRIVEEPTGDDLGELAMDVSLTEGRLRTIAGAIGYGSEDGIKVEASWEHRNLFPPEGALKFRGILGTREMLAGVGFRRNNFRGRDKLLSLDAYASDITTEAVEARTVGLRGSFERYSNLLFQKPFSWQFGAEVAFSDERNRRLRSILLPRREYLVGSLFGRATIDQSDSLLDPTRGFRITLFMAPEISRGLGREAFYLRGQVDGSYYLPASDGITLATRGRFATIQGAQTFEIAPSRRIYAGGGASVRGYGYQAVGPRNDFGQPTGGRSLVEFSAEARIDTGLFDGAVQVVPFFDLGTVSLDSTPDFRFVNYGVGVGVRYKTGFGPIRVDVGVPLNRNPMFDSPVAVYVSLGQAF